MARMSIFLLFGFVFFRLFSPVEAEAPSRDFLLTPSSAGRIRLGASKQEVLQLYRDHRVREVDLFLEGSPGSPALLIYRGKEFLLTAELLDDGTVYRIRTTNPKFATREGIRVGSTFGEAKRQYGEPSDVGEEEGLYAAFDLKSGTLSFRLRVEPYPLPKYLTDQSKIWEILVVRLP